MRFVITVLSIFIVTLLSCSEKSAYLVKGDAVPDIEFLAVDGETLTFNEYKGKTILIHFWADWCSECRAEFPKLEQAYQKYKKDGFEILAVNVAQSKSHVQSFKDEFGLNFPMLMDENSSVAKKFGIRGLPTNYFIGKEGRVERVIIGWVDEEQISLVLNNINSKGVN